MSDENPHIGPEKAKTRGPERPDEASKAERESTKKRAKLMSDAEKAALSRKIEEQKKSELKKMTKNLSEWKISVIRRGNPKINVDKWDTSSKAGLDLIKADWKKLGIYDPGNDFYQNVFNNLSQSADPKVTLSDDVKKAYQNPDRYREKLASLTDPAFVSSYSFFEAVRDIAKRQDLGQKSTVEKQQEKGKIPVVERIAQGVRDNAKSFMDAIKNRDYATAAVYGIGIFALYKAYKALPDGKKGFLGKAAAYGGSAFAIHLFLKNTGVDLGEKLGIKDSEADIAGTPLASLWKIEGVDVENLDSESANIMQDIAFVNLGSLYRKYQESNAAGDSKRAVFHFINPAAFGPSFPEFRGMRPTDIAGKKDLTFKQIKYRKVGRKLYKLVQSMEKAYDSTMRKPGQPSFEEVLEGGVLKNSTVFDFMVALRSFAADSKPESTILDIAKSVNVEQDMRKAFEGKNLIFSVERGPIKPGVFNASLMDFPIVIVADGGQKSYKVFSKADYEREGGNPHDSQVLAKFPFGGDSNKLKRPANKLVAAVTEKVNDLTKVFNKETGRSVDLMGVSYSSDGHWLGKLRYKRGKLLSGTTRPVNVKIKPNSDGTSLQITKMDNEVLVHIEDVMDREKLHGSLVLSQLVQQRDSGANFAPLAWFYRNRQLRFKDGDPSDGKFAIEIGNVSIDGKNAFEVEFKNGKYRFVDTGLEKKLLNDHVFRNELTESISEQGRLKDVTQSFSSLLENTPESFLINFFKSVPSWFTEARWHDPFRGLDLKDFAGSVPKNYFLGLLEAQKSLVIAKYAAQISQADSFDDINRVRSRIVDPAIIKLQSLRDSYSNMITSKERSGEDFSEGEFLTDIVDKVTKSGIETENYRTWYMKFANQIFDRFGRHDGAPATAKRSGKIVEVFGYYTAILDDPSIKSVDPNMRFTAEMMADIDAYNQAVEELGGSASDSKIVSKISAIKGAPFAAGDLNVVKKAAASKEKLNKYLLAKQYVNYVSGRIFTRINEDRVGDSVPGPGGFWQIEKFEQYKFNRPPGSSELVDSRPRLRMTHEFVTFDKYLKMAPAQRKNVPQGDVILPRKNCDLNFNANTDKAAFRLFIELIGRKDGEMAVTLNDANARLEMGQIDDRNSLAMSFHKKMRAALNKLKEKYPEEYKVGRFTDLMDDYSFDMKTATKGPNGNKMTVKFASGDTELSREVARIEQSLAGQDKRMVTRSQQESLLNQRVASIVKNKIMSNENFDDYFDRATLPKKLGNMWIDIKRFIFG